MNAYKERFAHDTRLRTLAEAMQGCRRVRWLLRKRLQSREIWCDHGGPTYCFCDGEPRPGNFLRRSRASRNDVIVATGRSDYPNQVNNVLGFPFIFRGALDVRATAINEEMKLAATRALAALAKEDVPDSVCRAYGVERLKFGRDYLIPKPFDPRVLVWEASAVAEAAMRNWRRTRTDEYWKPTANNWRAGSAKLTKSLAS